MGGAVRGRREEERDVWEEAQLHVHHTLDDHQVLGRRRRGPFDSARASEHVEGERQRECPWGSWCVRGRSHKMSQKQT